jgi:hypothetical protein
MTGPDQPQLSVELRSEAIDGRGRRRFSAWADDRLLGRLTTAEDRGWLQVEVEEEGGVNGTAERQALIAATIATARTEHLSGVVLAANSLLLVRHEARAAGFTGPLRAELVGDLRDLRDPRDPGRSPLGRQALQQRFLADLQRLLPGVVLEATDRTAGRLRSLLRSASTGVAGTVHLTAQSQLGDEPLRLAVPLGEDVLTEGVALAVDTALSVRRRFHPLIDGVRIFYDHSVQGLRTGTIGGVAEAYVRDVHLNPAYASVGEMVALDRFLRQRRGQPDPGEPERRSPLTVQPPFTRIDSVVAHEYWHQIEFGLESGRYRDSVDFRRVVGNYFGVETLEHVIKGASSSAPPAWQAAYLRLAREVSAYATTAPKEATAELFAQWWCTALAPPPSALAFGDVLRRFFPEADLVR